VTSGELAEVPVLEIPEPLLVDRSPAALSFREFDGGDMRIISVKAEVCCTEDMGVSIGVSGDTGSDTSSMASSQWGSLGILPS
jgi:hypothetical protein